MPLVAVATRVKFTRFLVNMDTVPVNGRLMLFSDGSAHRADFMFSTHVKQVPSSTCQQCLQQYTKKYWIRGRSNSMTDLASASALC